MDWSFYDPLSGLFAPCVSSMSVGVDPAGFAPSGFVPIAGRYDHLSQRVHLGTGIVVDYQPPSPANDDMRTWAWDGVSRRWVATPTIAAQRLSKIAELKAARDAKQFGGFVWDGSPFDSNERSQAVLLGMFTTAALGSLPDTPFRLQDNSWRVLSAADMVQVWGALQMLIAGAFAQFAALEAQVFAAETAQAVNAINWPE